MRLQEDGLCREDGRQGRKGHLRPGHRGPNSPLSYHLRSWASTEIREFYSHLEARNIEISKEHTEISTVHNVFSFLNRKKEKENGKAPVALPPSVGLADTPTEIQAQSGSLNTPPGGVSYGSLKVVEGEISFAKTLI